MATTTTFVSLSLSVFLSLSLFLTATAQQDTFPIGGHSTATDPFRDDGKAFLEDLKQEYLSGFTEADTGSYLEDVCLLAGFTNEAISSSKVSRGTKKHCLLPLTPSLTWMKS